MTRLDKLKYAVVSPDEDGNCVSFLDDEDLEELLSGKSRGENLQFKDLEFLKDNPYPQNWKEYEIVILKVDRVVVPVSKTVAWRLPE
jgi:hypothetical protein